MLPGQQHDQLQPIPRNLDNNNNDTASQSHINQ